MNKESNASDFRSELESLAEIEVLENEEMWSIRVIDEVSRKESIPGVIIQLPLQDNPTQR
jgi:5,10-methylene-tetrahydrofolate dehydrogenase/methenyl tetrahydrofolate cyclohydrolase